MRREEVEVYSDQTNAAVMRHPGRKFPGVLIQGDTLNSLCTAADRVRVKGGGVMDEESYLEFERLRGDLHGLPEHYKAVLAEQQVRLPFIENENE
jgi:hypothetical protein